MRKSAKIATVLLKTGPGGYLTKKFGYKNELHTLFRNAFSDQQLLLSHIYVETIFDIGANIGQTVVKYTRFFPESRIYSFEPFPDSFQKLRRRFEENSLVEAVQFAISNKVSKRKFYVNQNSVTNSLLPTVDDIEYVDYWCDKPNDVRNITTIEVPVTTIDEFCKQNSIDELQIVKMDIEGGELMALEGATEKLNQEAISLIFTEVCFIPIFEGHSLFYEIWDFLSDYEYTLFNVYNLTYTKNGQLRSGDAIFISPQVKTRMIGS